MAANAKKKIGLKQDILKGWNVCFSNVACKKKKVTASGFL